jgi:hypothetical protein
MAIFQDGEATMVLIDVKSCEERESTMACSNCWPWAMSWLLHFAAASNWRHRLAPSSQLGVQ